MIHTRTLLATTIIAASGLILAACSTGDPGGDGTQTAPDDEIVISYTNFTSLPNNEERLAEIVKAFEDENPGIRVEVTSIPNSDFFNTLQIDIAGGTVSDVFDVEAANFPTLQANGALASIDGLDTSPYMQSLIEQYSADGTLYALPSSFSTVVLYYNKDLFQAAGIETPQQDWTWDDAWAAAEAIADPDNNVWGLTQGISFFEFFKALQQAGGQFLSDDGTTVAFNSPEGIRAAQWLVDKSGVVMPKAAPAGVEGEDDAAMFAEGRLGLWLSGTWMLGAMADVPFEWDIAVEPGLVRQASHAFSNAVGMSATSSNIEAATQFAEFLTSSDFTVDTRLDAGWELPPIMDQAKLTRFLEMGNPENRQAVFDSLEAIAVTPLIGENQIRMQDILTDELSEVAQGRQTVEDALANAETRINPLIG